MKQAQAQPQWRNKVSVLISKRSTFTVVSESVPLLNRNRDVNKFLEKLHLTDDHMKSIREIETQYLQRNKEYLESMKVKFGTVAVREKAKIDSTPSVFDLFTQRGLIKNDPNLRKRKVACVIGYDGSGFYGSQISHDANHEKNFPSVEGTIAKSFHGAGLVSDLNSVDVKKIGWTRSSRTDKGVHSTCLVIGAKLLVNPKMFESNSSHYDPLGYKLCKKVNTHFPNGIRCFSIQKVSSSFAARQDCNYRRYEYLLPVELIEDHGRNTRTVTFETM